MAPTTPSLIHNEHKLDHWYYSSLVLRSAKTIQNMISPLSLVQCDMCKRDITKYTKIIANGDYCVGCFANHPEWPTSYRVISDLQFPLLEREWSAQEELFLIEGLLKYGLGNWGEIEEFMNGSKTAE